MSNPREAQIWGDEPEPTGEQRTVSGLIIPALGELAIEQTELAVHDLRRRQEIVGGLIDAVELLTPPATFYINDSGKLEGLPVNRRASAALWLGNKAFRGQDVLVGDCLLVGPADHEGDDTSVPEELTRLLTAPGGRVVEVRVGGEWHARIARFQSFLSAARYAFAMEAQHSEVEDVRVRMEEDV